MLVKGTQGMELQQNEFFIDFESWQKGPQWNGPLLMKFLLYVGQ